MIVIEGVDGCGKSSVAEELMKRLRGDDGAGEVIHFPNDQAVTGPMIRDYLKRGWAVVGNDGSPEGVYDAPGSALVFQALNVTNRMELMPMIVEAKRRRVPLVLVRYWQSAWVYGQLDGLSPDWLFKVHQAMVAPDLNILLDVDAEVGLERRAARDGALPPERYEGKLDFTRRVVDLYRELWTRMEPAKTWVRIDASRSFDAVVADVLDAVGL